MLKIYNTLGRELQEFKPIEEGKVRFYACGPTVYDYAHIGHGRKYVNDDIIKRSLKYLGYDVKHVMNITDVGHLVSDADEGEDKLEKGALKTGKSVWEVAEMYTQDFYEMISLLNIIKPEIISKATDHIPEQISLIEKLFENGYAYDTPEAVYFDVSKFPKYSEILGQSLNEKIVGARDEVNTETSKKNPADFALWFKRIGKFANHSMHWESPWGDGFPGWHIECSAMSMKYLGDQLDIHTGGIDHIPVHHPNEIAQSEGGTGKIPFVKYWIHHDFLNVDGTKMSKSLGNFYRVADIVAKGYDPMVLRYFYHTAGFHKPLNFTFEALDASKTAYERLINLIRSWLKESSDLSNLDESSEGGDFKSDLHDFNINKEYQDKFIQALEEDFNIPKALAVLWEVTKADLQPDDKIATILNFDKVLGLKLEEKLNDPEESKPIVTDEAQKLIDQRNESRAMKDWATADRIRDELKEKFGLDVVDVK